MKWTTIVTNVIIVRIRAFILVQSVPLVSQINNKIPYETYLKGTKCGGFSKKHHIFVTRISYVLNMSRKVYPTLQLPYETYLYGTKFGDFWKKSPYFRTSKIVTAISISHTLIFYVIGLNRANSR